MPSPKAGHYVISGTVTVGGSAYQGAKVWAWSGGYHTHWDTVQDATYYYTDSSGKYIMDVANIASAVTNADKIMVICQAGDQKDFKTVTIATTGSGATQDFAFSNSSNLTDALKSNSNTDGTGALLHNALRKGCKDEMT